MTTSNADILIVGARVITMDPARPAVQALAIKDGRVIATGDEATVSELRGNHTEVRDAGGAFVTPGLIDAHLHPIQGIELANGLDAGGLTRPDQLLAALRIEADRVLAENDGGWVRAWNVDYEVFMHMPATADAIDDAVRGLPALLIYFDGHTALASSEALRRANVTGRRDFADTSEIVVDASGRPTGELREPGAIDLVMDIAPVPGRDESLAFVRGVMATMSSSGMTGGCIMDGTAPRLELLAALDEGEGLPIRIVTAVDHQPGFDEERTQQNFATRDLAGRRWRAGIVKFYTDGVVETGTSWLYEPDTAGEGREPFWKDEGAYARMVARYAEQGFLVATHAIGDRAIGAAIDAYVAAGVRSRNGAGTPHRIEHLETTADRDVARLAAYGITASLQPIHMQWRKADGSDDWSRRLGPERAARAFRVGDMQRAGVPLALGSDWPIAQVDARLGLAWTRLRRAPGALDATVLEPEQRLSGYEALHGYTVGAAIAQGDLDLGRLVPGAKADYAVWADNPIAVSGDELATLPVLETAVGGAITHRAA